MYVHNYMLPVCTCRVKRSSLVLYMVSPTRIIMSMHCLCLLCHCVHYFRSIPKQLLKVTVLSRIIFAGDSSGSLPSHDAAYHDKLQCLKILIKKGAKSSLQDDKGRNVLHKVRGRSCG